MSRVATALPDSKVARFITAQIEASEKRQSEIATDIGILPVNQNFISMMKTGKTKLPISKVRPLAKSLGLDRKHLLRMTIQEYHPEMYVELKDEFDLPMLSAAEKEWLDILRACKHENPRLKTATQKREFKEFLNTLGD